MNTPNLLRTARELVALYKGILAADESTQTIQKRFDVIGVESTPEHRRAYRELLFSAPGIGQYISGVILFDETIRQKTASGIPFPKVLSDAGVIPGIKVDLGTESFVASPNETFTVGLDGLKERLAEYASLGARFAKWRAVIRIDTSLPTDQCIAENAESLSEYARMCQEKNIVPIVEPEVLSDGDHSSGRCFEVTEMTLRRVFEALKEKKIDLSGMLLKPNMIVPGVDSHEITTPENVADMTIRVLKKTVPSEVPGIVFLSGGQSEREATANLNAMRVSGEQLPWTLTFSYGRALQTSVLAEWAGKDENVQKAQEIFLKRARLNSLACQGKYSTEME